MRYPKIVSQTTEECNGKVKKIGTSALMRRKHYKINEITNYHFRYLGSSGKKVLKVLIY